MNLDGFPPLLGPEPHILILGSFPSAESLRLQAYYGHPRNHFWHLVGRAFDCQPPDDGLARRQWLMDLGIAVWDVIAACERQGSLDQAIRHPEPNDLEGFLADHPSIATIILNGSKAAAEFRRLGERSVFQARRVVAVPSSSPVPSRQYRCLEDKVAAWRSALRA